MATVRFGDKGSNVTLLQDYLYAASYYHNRRDFDPQGVDGIFGKNTQAAVRNFQAAVGLSVTGIADDQTFAALDAVVQSEPGSVAFYTSGSIAGNLITGGKGITSGGPIPGLPPPGGSKYPPDGQVQGPVYTAIQGSDIDWKTIGLVGAGFIALMLLTGPKKR